MKTDKKIIRLVAKVAAVPETVLDIQTDFIRLDAALKMAEVELKVFYGPPTETNFAGGLLTGSQAACQAACDAFADAVCAIAGAPLEY